MGEFLLRDLFNVFVYHNLGVDIPGKLHPVLQGLKIPKPKLPYDVSNKPELFQVLIYSIFGNKVLYCNEGRKAIQVYQFLRRECIKKVSKYHCIEDKIAYINSINWKYRNLDEIYDLVHFVENNLFIIPRLYRVVMNVAIPHSYKLARYFTSMKSDDYRQAVFRLKEKSKKEIIYKDRIQNRW